MSRVLEPLKTYAPIYLNIAAPLQPHGQALLLELKTVTHSVREESLPRSAVRESLFCFPFPPAIGTCTCVAGALSRCFVMEYSKPCRCCAWDHRSAVGRSSDSVTAVLLLSVGLLKPLISALDYYIITDSVLSCGFGDHSSVESW